MSRPAAAAPPWAAHGPDCGCPSHPRTVEIPRRVLPDLHHQRSLEGLRDLTVDVATTREVPSLALAPLSPPARGRRRVGCGMVLLPAVLLLGWMLGGGGGWW